MVFHTKTLIPKNSYYPCLSKCNEELKSGKTFSSGTMIQPSISNRIKFKKRMNSDKDEQSKQSTYCLENGEIAPGSYCIWCWVIGDIYVYVCVCIYTYTLYVCACVCV